MTRPSPGANGRGLVADGRAVYLCEECGETFERGPDLLHVTCPACGTNAVDVVVHV